MEGTKAKQFTCIDQTGKEHRLEDYLGKRVLLYFYPKNSTPGCTTEALGFQEKHDEFTLKNTVILAVSRDSQESHKAFCEEQGLTFPLLVDSDGSLTESYGVWKEQSMFGKKYMGISRESFLIDEEGVIIKHWSKVKPKDHPEEVLEYIREQA